MKETVQKQADIIVAGLICLDIIIGFENQDPDFAGMPEPGKTINVGRAMTTAWGAVANTGMALHQLGIPTKLIGKLGADMFGDSILDILRKGGDFLTKGILVDEGEQTSYCIVLSPPGIDRSFLYNPGANDNFQAADIQEQELSGARFLHFGYPTDMYRIYTDNGIELIKLLQKAKKRGLTTSLDMGYPDPNTEAGRMDWRAWLRGVLPLVDIFLPSLAEIIFMLDRPRFEALQKEGKLQTDADLLDSLARQLLDMGAAIVGLKLGDQGFYIQTTADPDRLEALGTGKPSDANQWLNRTISTPCFKANVVGTTGAGDCTIAGFLAGFSKDLPPQEVLTMAVPVGGFSVESADATSGIPDWDTVRQRVEAGWSRLSEGVPLEG